MKKKFLTISLIATSIATTCASGVTAFAESKTGTVPVSYTTKTLVADTDYAVSIPKALTFTDNHRTLNADLKLTNPNGTDYTGAAITVTAKVKSANGLKLKNASNEELAYTLKYGSKALTSVNTDQDLTNLTNDNPTLTGEAVLPDTSQAVTNGTYTDTLTFTFDKQ